MTNKLEYIKKDDLFIIGNIGLISVDCEYNQQGLKIMQYVQKVSPNNAAGYIGEAVYLFLEGDYDKAVSILEEGNALEAEENGDLAMALHISLLHAAGRSDEAMELTETYVNEGLITDETALKTLKNTQRMVEESRSTTG